MRIGILLFSCLLSLSSFGQLKAIYNQADYPFLLHLPADSILKNHPPVLIFLHGRSLSGNNLELVKKYGIIHEIEKGREIPAIVIAPQVPAGKRLGWAGRCGLAHDGHACLAPAGQAGPAA